MEFNWDGVPAIVAAAGERLRVTSRNGNDITGGYPEIAASRFGDGRSSSVDGELVALDAGARRDLGLLQQRMHVRAPQH